MKNLEKDFPLIKFKVGFPAEQPPHQDNTRVETRMVDHIEDCAICQE